MPHACAGHEGSCVRTEHSLQGAPGLQPYATPRADRTARRRRRLCPPLLRSRMLQRVAQSAIAIGNQPVCDVSRITRGKIKFNKEMVDPGRIAAQAAEATRAAVQQRGQKPAWPIRLGSPRSSAICSATRRRAAISCPPWKHPETNCWSACAMRRRHQRRHAAARIRSILYSRSVAVGVRFAHPNLLVACMERVVRAVWGRPTHSAGPCRGSEFVVRMPLQLSRHLTSKQERRRAFIARCRTPALPPQVALR